MRVLNSSVAIRVKADASVGEGEECFLGKSPRNLKGKGNGGKVIIVAYDLVTSGEEGHFNYCIFSRSPFFMGCRESK